MIDEVDFSPPQPQVMSTGHVAAVGSETKMRQCAARVREKRRLWDKVYLQCVKLYRWLTTTPLVGIAVADQFRFGDGDGGGACVSHHSSFASLSPHFLGDQNEKAGEQCVLSAEAEM